MSGNQFLPTVSDALSRKDKRHRKRQEEIKRRQAANQANLPGADGVQEQAPVVPEALPPPAVSAVVANTGVALPENADVTSSPEVSTSAADASTTSSMPSTTSVVYRFNAQMGQYQCYRPTYFYYISGGKDWYNVTDEKEKKEAEAYVKAHPELETQTETQAPVAEVASAAEKPAPAAPTGIFRIVIDSAGLQTVEKNTGYIRDYWVKASPEEAAAYLATATAPKEAPASEK